jgi:hypothetical protein
MKNGSFIAQATCINWDIVTAAMLKIVIKETLL